jgi:hypothetical protein
MKASHKRRIATVGYQKIEIQPGQFITGGKVSARETGLSVKQARTCMLKLKKYGKVAIKTTNKFSIITIVNWDIYQRPYDQKGNQKGNQRANKGQTKGNRQRMYKECNNDNKKDEAKLIDLNDAFLAP